MYLVGPGLNSGLGTCKAGARKAGTLPTEPHLHFFLVTFGAGVS
jgi:hypothetical protein